MAKQRVSDLLSLFSIAMCMEEGIDSNILLMSPDMPDDILTDPGLRKELFPGWWDSDGFKLPQTYVKTVPMDAGVSLISLIVNNTNSNNNNLYIYNMYVKNIIDKFVDCGLCSVFWLFRRNRTSRIKSWFLGALGIELSC